MLVIRQICMHRLMRTNFPTKSKRNGIPIKTRKLPFSLHDKVMRTDGSHPISLYKQFVVLQLLAYCFFELLQQAAQSICMQASRA